MESGWVADAWSRGLAGGDPRWRPRHMARNIGADYISPPISHDAERNICINLDTSRRRLIATHSHEDFGNMVSEVAQHGSSCQASIRFGHKMRLVWKNRSGHGRTVSDLMVSCV